MTDPLNKAELGAFLRKRREAVDPVTVGLPLGTRRRTPGLRREEIAQLAGVSHTWYTWLEQGRDIGVSRQVLERLGGALRLDPAERHHLFTLAGLALPPGDGGLPEVSAVLRRLVMAQDPNPAYVVNQWWDLLAYNKSYGALLGGIDGLSLPERNMLWLMFTHDRVRKLFVDWQSEARQLVGQLRTHLARYPDNNRGSGIVSHLSQASASFAELWQDHDVRQFKSARKRLQLPGGIKLELDYTKLITAENEQDHMVIFMPADEQSRVELNGLARPA